MRASAALPAYTLVLLILLILLCMTLPGAAEERGFVLLFDGRTLAGWEPHGRAETIAQQNSVGPFFRAMALHRLGRTEEAFAALVPDQA